MGGDIAEWSARQGDASYDERDQISIVTVLEHDETIPAGRTNRKRVANQKDGSRSDGRRRIEI